ncbi:MAG: hypothetical protein LBJ76_04805 [Candidatus Accumulibacter sp.]|jgi:hypothetical protein|nr:hypothetical protein [Accumulibacter sp.]
MKPNLFLLALPLLAACSDQRASYEIDGNKHVLSLVRVTGFPWEKTAKYTIVPTRMPDCMRRHDLPNASLNARFEVYSAGDNAWALRQRDRIFVTETRTCEGFAPLAQIPETGLGTLVGVFEMRNGSLVFTPAVIPPTSPSSSAPLNQSVDSGERVSP